MKKTNAMIEVSDAVYEDIVMPFKKKKSFGKLITMLLEAYATNDSIYSYINGAMDGLENEATEELLKDLNSMAESLSMLGALNSEAESVIDNGQRVFDDFGSRATQDSEKVQGAVGGVSREDVVEIVNESVSEIKDMLKELLSGAVTINQGVQPQSEEAVATKEESKVEEISKEDEEKAQGALASLMGSLQY